MEERVGEYKLECYRKVMPLGEKENLWLVKDSVTGGQFVMRKVSKESAPVYERLAKLCQEGIMEIFDVFPYGGFLYVVGEYLEWELLSEAAARKPLSTRQVVSVGRQLLDALVILHGEGIVHRDIKPENIMVDPHGAVKLIDFDIARIFAEEKDADTTVKGSRAYASPEQYGFAQTDPRTDLYSLGVTLNELAVGELPEQRRCRGALGVFIRRCTEFDPKRRYQSAREALRHLRRLEKRRLWHAAAVSGILLAFLAVGAILLSPDGEGEGGRETAAASASGETGALGYGEATAGTTETGGTQASEELFGKTEYPDRIVFMQKPDRYPSFLMTEDGIYEGQAELGEGQYVSLSAEKSGETLFLTVKSQDGNASEFVFDDIGRELYTGRAEGLERELEGKIPEYEILLDDIDGDGVEDLLVAFARRRLINTPYPEDRYYLMAYSLLWVVHRTDDDGWRCSETLFFSDCRPHLEQDRLIFNDTYLEFYGFENGIWEIK